NAHDRMRTNFPGVTPMSARIVAVVMCLSASVVAMPEPEATPQAASKFTREQASVFARITLASIGKEYPNKPAVVLNVADDVKPPRHFHPAFYGSFDWHSAVHGHWLLVKVLK